MNGLIALGRLDHIFYAKFPARNLIYTGNTEQGFTGESFD